MPAKKRALRDGKKGVASYKGKSNYKGKKTYQSTTERATTECLLSYKNDNLKRAMKPDLTGEYADDELLSCFHTIPIQVKGDDLMVNFNKNVKDKYEEYRIAKVEVRVMFKETNTPVWYVIDEKSTAKVSPEQFEQNQNAGLKMIKENNNQLTLTWRPQKGSKDYDYLPVTNDPSAQAPLAHLHILQHEIQKCAADAIEVNKKACHIQTKVFLACRGNKSTIGGAAELTAAQTAAITAYLGN